MKHRKRYDFLLKVFISLILSFLLLLAQEQQLENTVKVGFVEKFTRFIEWRSSSDSTEGEYFVIGYFERNPFGNVLNDIFSRLSINEKPVIVRQINNMAEVEHCQVLIIPDIPIRRLKQLLQMINHKPILTIGNTNGFCELGVLINLYQSEDGYIRFEINHGAFLDSGLKVDSRLFKLARILNFRSGKNDTLSFHK